MSRAAVVTLLIATLLLVFGFTMNPTPERHRQKIKEAMAARSPVAGALGLGSLKGAVSTYHSLGVASYTTLQDRTVSVGAYGVVYVP